MGRKLSGCAKITAVAGSPSIPILDMYKFAVIEDSSLSLVDVELTEEIPDEPNVNHMNVIDTNCKASDTPQCSIDSDDVGQPQEIQTQIINNSFIGFDSKEIGSRLRLHVLKSKLNVSDPELNSCGDTQYSRHTRSKGPVLSLPNVQPKILERKNRI